MEMIMAEDFTKINRTDPLIFISETKASLCLFGTGLKKGEGRGYEE